MKSDLRRLKKLMAEYKVYDAWQYVQSLQEIFDNMYMACALLSKAYEHRKQGILGLNQELFEEAASNPGKAVPVTWKRLAVDNQTIYDMTISDTFIMRKNTLDFFHYARLCYDILAQIINASLFGINAFSVEDDSLPMKVSRKLKSVPAYKTLFGLVDGAFKSTEIKYTMAFDNYIKHIKTVPFTIKNNIFFGDNAEFKLASFIYRGTPYSEVDAVPMVESVYNMIVKLMDDVLCELENLIPTVTDTAGRIQDISFKWIMREENGKSFTNYFSTFIEVDNGLQDLPSEIYILPLKVNAEGECHTSSIPINKIFITIKGKGEDGICGVAIENDSNSSVEKYTKFSVTACGTNEYSEYVRTFLQNYTHVNGNFRAMTGELISIPSDKNEGSEQV